jgi:hypothetical protein
MLARVSRVLCQNPFFTNPPFRGFIQVTPIKVPILLTLSTSKFDLSQIESATDRKDARSKFPSYYANLVGFEHSNWDFSGVWS